MSCTHIRDIAHLKVGDIQKLSKFYPVGRRLIEHNDKLAVCKHCPRRMALQKVVHVLGDTCTISTVFTHTLPEGKKEVRRVFMLEQQINLVNENERVSAFGSVLRDTVQDAVKDNKHTDGL